MCKPRMRQPGLIVALLPLPLAGCSGEQSSLDPAGRSAEQIADLFWWMTGGAVVVWLIVVWLAVSAIRGKVSEHTERQAR